MNQRMKDVTQEIYCSDEFLKNEAYRTTIKKMEFLANNNGENIGFYVYRY